MATATVSTTTLESAIDDNFEKTVQIVTSVNLAILMLGLGAAISPKEMWEYIKRPKQFLTGLLLQLFLMPFLGLLLTEIVRMSELEALGVIIQASCPGGSYSNVMSYWLDGDMNLSVVMTTASTIISIGSLPLWLFVMPKLVYADSQDSQTIQIPFADLGYALLGSVGPIFVGMAIKWKLPQYSEKFSKFCTVLASVAIIITSIVIAATQDRTIVITWKQGVLAVIFPACALLLGYGATRLPCLTFTVQARRTVAIETAMQNSAIATTIVILSFDTSGSDFITVFMFPVLYGGIQLFGGISAVTTYLIVKRRGHVGCIQKEMVVPPEILEKMEEENQVTDTKIYAIETDPDGRNIAAGFEFNEDYAGNGISNPSFVIEHDSHPNVVGSPKLEKKVDTQVLDSIDISNTNYKESNS